MTTWSVHHPGIGVLDYATETDARVAAGTAGTLLRDGQPEPAGRPASIEETIGELYNRLPVGVWTEAYGMRVKRLAPPATEEGHRP